MYWIDKYKDKIITLEEAVSYVKSNCIIFLSGNAATPRGIIENLAALKDELENVQVNHLLMMGDDPLSAPGMEKHFRHNSLFVGPADRAAVNEGRSDYVPVFLFEVPSLFTKQIIPLDVAYIHVSPPDDHGFMSYGVECVASKAAAESAKFIVAQVNENMPRTLGDSFIHISRVNKIIENNEEIPVLNKKGFSEVEKKIGEYIADLVDDGATMQMGIGGIPDAVLAALEGKKDLGIHTEMVSDGVVEGIEKGFITNRRKTLHPGKVIATFILGSKRLYEFVNNNPYFEIHPCNYTNNPFIVAQNERMVAINSAIEVDITGQVCSDSIGTRIYSGFGGQVDFIRGAAYAKGGKPIIALPSTAKNDTISKITPQLKPGAGVVTTRADVHYVVTEHGVAYLHGKNLRQRVRELANVAHPQFRDELLHYAKKQKYM
jgi:4-hydroxybutyrate CoA-transferase